MALLIALAVVVAGAIALCVMSIKRPYCVVPLILSVYTLEIVLLTRFSFLVHRMWFVNAAVALFALTVLVLNSRHIVRAGILSSPQLYASLLLILLCGVSTQWALDPAFAMQRFLKNCPHLLAYGVVGPFAIFNLRHLSKAFRLFIAFGVAILVAVHLSDFGFRGVMARHGGREFELAALAPASLSGRVVICAILSLFAVGKGSRGTLFRVLCGVAIVLGVLAIARSGSRGQLVACLGAILLWASIVAAMLMKQKRLPIFVSLVLLGSLGYWSVMNTEASSFRWQRKFLRSGTTNRLQAVSGVWEAYVSGGPVTWVAGLGNTSSWDIVGQYPHLVAVEVLAEEGILGFACFAFIVIQGFRDGMYLLRRRTIAFSMRLVVATMLTLLTYEFLITCKQGDVYAATHLFFCGIGMSWLKRQYVVHHQQPQATRDTPGNPSLGRRVDRTTAPLPSSSH